MIRKLSQDVIGKIAAGEVIERPAYVVKELVENALDAKATHISLSVEDFGLKKITVTDDGIGMSGDDLQVSFLPHTTSKLTSVEDLSSIKTFGFRGEALSSISHVSILTIQTRQKKDIGGMTVTIKNGDVEELTQIGSPKGTTVTVSHLFSNLPARKKFLKSNKTEFRLLSELFSTYALSHPDVHFVFKHNGKIIFDLPPMSVEERIAYLLGSVSEQLIPVRKNDDGISLTGFIGRPQIASRNQKQFLFVNSRFVKDQMIGLSVKEAFGTLLPTSFYPVFFLSLSLPVEMVDVNIHPRKEKVSFFNQRSVFDAVKQTISESLSEHNLTFRLATYKNEHSALISETASDAGQHLKEEVATPEIISLGIVTEENTFLQIDKTYIVVPTKNGFIVVDQHAAHERILFETFRETFTTKKKRSEIYELPTPKTVRLSLGDSELLDEYEQDLQKLGFVFEHLKATGLIIRKIPYVFKGRNIEKIIDDIISDFRNGGISDIDKRTEKMLMYLSCRSAVKAGDPLSTRQMKELMIKLKKTHNNTTCPHGRPTMIAFSQRELASWFKRK